LPEEFHGKEGVDGSSPSEGFDKWPAYCRSVFSPETLTTESRTQDGHEVVTRGR
jgi:hypothetical protein